MADLRAGAGPAAKSHLKELARLMEGARTEAVKNFSQLLDKLDNIKQVNNKLKHRERLEVPFPNQSECLLSSGSCAMNIVP